MHENTPLSKIEGAWLLDFIQSSIKTYLEEDSSLPQERAFSTHSLHKKIRGIFITLFKQSELRGCFGSPYATKPIIDTILTMMDEGALQDPRLSPLTLEELSTIQIELSILTSPVPIEAHQIEIGVHGLILERDEQKSLFLPKVAVLYNWTTQTLLENLSLKANLPKDAWQESKLLSFQVQQIFKTPDLKDLKTLSDFQVK